jgi:hypothetical protein
MFCSSFVTFVYLTKNYKLVPLVHHSVSEFGNVQVTSTPAEGNYFNALAVLKIVMWTSLSHKFRILEKTTVFRKKDVKLMGI